MKKSTLFMIVSVVLALTLSLGGTLAYLTDTDYDTNVMVLGKVDIEQHETDSEGNTFQDGQMLLPIVGSAKDVDDRGYPTPSNYIDKIVTVENKSDSVKAYARTLIAIPVYTYEGQETGAAYDNVLHWNGYSQGDNDAAGYPIADQYLTWDEDQGTQIHDAENQWSWGVDKDAKVWPGNNGKWNNVYAKINDKLYEVVVATHVTPLEPGARTAPSLTGVYLDCNVDYDNDNGYYTYEGKEITGLEFGQNVEVLVLTQAVQYDSSWGDPWTALNTAFGEITVANVVEWFDATAVTVSTNEELKSALTADQEKITVILKDDLTYDVAAWNKNAMGGSITEEINIIGNGNTLTFEQKDSDWNNVVTNNGAELVLTDVNVTNSGHNDGPWNRHDINFACDVAMNNVTSDKAFAFMAGAVLNNVTISDANTSDTYAIWIQPNGQTVSLDNCVIDMLACTDGRGIKIDEQYVGAPAKVTLNVANTVFKTEEKSAILVKSVAGADITLNNVDISAVAADSTNPVWVDEASAAYADLVTVTGGNKIVEH